MIFNNFAQLKNTLEVGNTIILLSADFGGYKVSEKIMARINKMRLIMRKQTNAIKLDDGSWLGLGSTGEKAKDFIFYGDNRFTYKDDFCVLNYQVFEN